MKKCPFCSEEIQSEAIKCRYCGEWLNTKPTIGGSDEQLKSQEKLRGQGHSLHEASKIEPPPVLLPKQSTAATPPIEKKNEEPYKTFSWKSLILAFVIAAVINGFASAAAGTKPAKNIIWTTMWIYLTIEAWKYWKWKALLPYPIFILTYGVIVGLIMPSVGVDYRGWTDVIVKGLLNIGGLIIFYAIFRNSQKAHEMNYPVASPMKSETKPVEPVTAAKTNDTGFGLLKGIAVLPAVVFLIFIILIVVCIIVVVITGTIAD